MVYLFEKKKINCEELASGSIIQSYKGMPAFPIRLALEIYQRCKVFLKKHNILPPYSIYDPCCGSGYILTTLGILNSKEIERIYASDISKEAIELTNKNLSLLKEEGFLSRIFELEQLIGLYNNDSHRLFLAHAKTLKDKLIKDRRPDITVLQRNILSDNVEVDIKVNIIITDIPYNRQSDWKNDEHVSLSTQAVQERFLNNIYRSLEKDGVASIITPKTEKLFSDKLKIVDKFIVGKRRIYILIK
jgi:23S rRNA (guanine2535-N1)-methyltransferase